MAEFRGSARSSGFNAIDLPDNAYRIKQAGQKRIDDLRTAYAKTIQNKKQNLQDFQYDQSQVRDALDRNANLEETFRRTYEQALRKRGQDRIDNQKKKAEMERSRYDRLSQFSKEAGKIGAEIYDQYKEDRQREGMSLIFHTGLTADELKTLQQSEDELLAEHTAANAIIEKLKRNGASASQIKQIRDLDGWILLGAQKELAKNAGTAYQAHLKNPEIRNKKFKLQSGREVSLEQASRELNEDDYTEVRGLLTSEFLKAYQGYDLAFAEQYIFPNMRKTKENDDLDFRSKLQEKFEKEEEIRFRTSIVNLSEAMQSDPRAFETFILSESGNDRDAMGVIRRRVLETVPQMVKNGNFDGAKLFLSNLRKQKFTISGKEVTFEEQYLGKNGLEGRQLINRINDAITDQDKKQYREEQFREEQLRDSLLKEAVRQAKGDGLSDDEAKAIINTLAAKGLSPIGDLKNILVTRALPVDIAAQAQMARQEIAMGATFTEAQLAAKFPALTPTLRQQIVSAGSIVGSDGRSRGLSVHIDALAQLIDPVLKQMTLQDSGYQKTAMLGILRKEFTEEFFRRKSDKQYIGYSDDKLAKELELNFRQDLLRGEGIFERNTDKDGNVITGTGGGFSKVLEAPIVDSPLWKQTIKTIDNNANAISDKKLLGDMNDPSSWAAQIPKIIETGEPTAWLTSMARYTNTPWKILFNRQAALYGNYRLPLSRLEDAAEGISPGFFNRIGVPATAAGVFMGSVNQARAQGAQGLEVYRPLLNLIASYESSNDTVHGGYDAMNLGGTHGGSVPIGSNTGAVYFQKPLVEMTVGEVMDLQADKKLWAAGRYQFIGPTLKDVFNRGQPGGISRDSLFDAATQDKLAVTYIRMTMREFPGDPTSGIRNRWIGVRDHVSYDELQQIIDRIQQDTRVQGTAFANHEIDPAIYAHSANRK